MAECGVVLGPKVYYSYDHEGGHTEKDLSPSHIGAAIAYDHVSRAT